MALGRISGPLLKANLLRDGIDLAFETDLLYLDVINGRIGIKTISPTHALTVNGTIRTTNLETTVQADIASFTINTNLISSSNGIIRLEPSGSNPVVYQSKILVNDNLQISTNAIQTTVLDSDLEIRTNGTGNVNINSNVLVTGDIHATGNITADGSIILGDASTDGITFNADVASNIIPDLTNFYDLGSDPTIGGQAWKDSYLTNIHATTVTTDTLVVNGIDIKLPQGNIIYVSTNGSDTNAGVHENNPVLTVKYALSIASSGDTVFIYPGVYSELFPITIPVGVSIRGSGIRSVTIQPTVGTIDNDAFLLNGEVTVEDLTIANFKFNIPNNTGYAFRFANNFTVTSRSPYLKNLSVITRGSVTNVGDPYGFDSNDAGKGMFFDGSVANASSNQAAVLCQALTFITPNQEAVVATNGVRIEWINSFIYFADKGMYAYSSAAGFAGIGMTRLRFDNKVGAWLIGDTVSYYDIDGTTLLASGVIDSFDGNFVNLTGRQLGFEEITDRTPKAVYASGTAKISTAQSKFGGSSLSLETSGGFVNVASQPDFNFGTGAFTIELWVYPTTTPGVPRLLLDMRTANPQVAVVLSINDTNTISFFVNGAARSTSSVTISTNVWTHIAVSKIGTSTKLFVNGVQSGITYTDNNTYIQSPVRIGARFDNTLPFIGYIDDVRISKGIGRYASDFLVPTSVLPGDYSTVLSLHFNGNNNSTTILDDGVTLQDIRTSSGGTSSLINYADYSDFGVEIRSIGSVNMYGNYGVYADGSGVVIHLTSHNFAYVGSGKSSANIPHHEEDELVDVDIYEITKLNKARVYYVSVNEEGDFRIGDKFYVDQATGDVLFNSQNLNITSTTGVTFTDGVYSTIITAHDITTGNIRISGNTIESLTGDINVNSANGIINLQNDTFITGDLDVTGDVTIGGNITIGDQPTDNVTFVAKISSNLVPKTTAFYDLGTDDLRWNTAFLSRAEIDGLVIDSNTISTTIGNDNLILSANGLGKIYVPTNDVQIDHNLTVNQDLTVTAGTSYLKAINVTGTIDQTGNFIQTGDFTTSGNVEVTGNIISTGYVQLPQIKIIGNSIFTTTTNTDLEVRANGLGNVIIESIKVSDNNIQSIGTNTDITLVPQGTGGIVINSNQSLQIPVGTTGERPISPTNGMVRYNTSLSRYEGWNNGYWLQLSGVIDNSGKTRILAEATPGANDNILYFYANDNLTATIDSTKLFTQRFQTTGLDINGNTISSIATNSDINLTAAGTGNIRFGNLSIRNNTITNIVSDAVTDFVETGAGYVRIAGTNGVVIPSGDSINDRPTFTELGMIRFNTYLQIVEIFDGVIWKTAAGASAGISLTEATSLGILSAIIYG